MQYELLKYLSSGTILSMPTLNSFIQSFPYFGPDAKNRPSPITTATLTSSDHGLEQTGGIFYILLF